MLPHVSSPACGPVLTLALQCGLEQLWMFGSGDEGKLGLGDFDNRSNPTLVCSPAVVHPGTVASPHVAEAGQLTRGVLVVRGR